MMSLKNKMLAASFLAAFSLSSASYADSLITAGIKNSTNSVIVFKYDSNKCAYNYERKEFSINPGDVKRIVFNADEGGHCRNEDTTFLAYKFSVLSTRGGKGKVSIEVSKHTHVNFTDTGLSKVATEVDTIEGVPTYIIYGG